MTPTTTKKSTNTRKNTKSSATASQPTNTRDLRQRLGLTQPDFARLLGISTRSVAQLESGENPKAPVERHLTEIKRLTDALAEVIQKESLGEWLKTPNQALDGSKPLEIVERGETDRLWEMMYFLRSGVPS